MQTDTPDFLGALNSERWQDRQEAAEALRKGEGPLERDMEQAILDLLDDHVLWVRQEAALVLAGRGAPGAAEKMMARVEQLAGSDNSLHRLMALELQVVAADRKEANRILIQVLRQEEDPIVWQAAFDEICRQQEPAAVFDLQELKNEGRLSAADLARAVADLKEQGRKSLVNRHDDPVCGWCLARFVRYRIKTGFLRSLSFYGCRRCGMTGNRLERVKKLVAVIDTPWEEEYRIKDETLYVNMTMRPRNAPLAEFDLLEIRAAGGVDLNEELGHILRRSGDDSHMSQERLRTLPVRLVDNPDLTQNSLNLLNMRFREVRE